MIGKELLSEVLNLEMFEDCEPHFLGGITEIWYEVYIQNKTDTVSRHNNIHELAHKCKEWAYEKGYSLVSWKNTKEWWFVDIRENGNMVVECKREDSEPEVIFQACQYILDNIESEEK